MDERLSEIIDLTSAFNFISIYGLQYKKEKLNSDNILFQVLGKIIPRFVSDILTENNYLNYIVKAGLGQCGQWSNTPYVCILDKVLSSNGRTYTPSKGIYPTFLLSPDCKTVYLTYMISVGSKNDRELSYIVSEMRKIMNLDNYAIDTANMNLGHRINHYRSAVICYVEYNLNESLMCSVLKNDLIEIMKLHTTYKDNYQKIIAKLWPPKKQ